MTISFPIIAIIAVCIKLALLIFGVFLMIRLWRACDAIMSLERTVQFMAYDLKDLREKFEKDRPSV